MTTSKQEARAAYLEQEESRIRRVEYLKPLILLAIGVGIGTVIDGMRGWEADGLTGAAFAILGLVIAIGISAVVGLIGLAIASMIMGLDAGPAPLVLLRLAAVFAILLPVSDLLPAGVVLLWAVAMLFVLAGLIALLFDFEVSTRRPSSCS